MESSGVNELVKYAIFPHIGTVIHSLVINEKVWQSLPEDIQKALMQAGQDSLEQSGVSYDEKSVEINDDFLQIGGTIAELTEEEHARWKKVTDKFTQDWLKRNKSNDLPYEEILKLYNDNLEKYKEKH